MVRYVKDATSSFRNDLMNGKSVYRVASGWKNGDLGLFVYRMRIKDVTEEDEHSDIIYRKECNE